MPSVSSQVIRPVPSLGVLGELLLVFLEYEVVELTALARVPLEICVVEAACLPQPRLGDAGTAE